MIPIFQRWLNKKSQQAHILENFAPGLVYRLQEISLDQRRNLLIKAIQWVYRSIQRIEPELQHLLNDYRQAHILSEVQVKAVRAFAEAADEKYFELKERDPNSKDWEDWFDNARLATALANAAGNTSWTGTADAIYELRKR